MVSVNNLFWKILVTRVKRKMRDFDLSCRGNSLASIRESLAQRNPGLPQAHAGHVAALPRSQV
jgi:hypothetical protein